MNKILQVFGVAALLFAGQASFAQSNAEKALAKGKEAIRLEDEEGKYDEAIKLFAEAQQLDPPNINYPYEMAYAYSGKKEYKKASDILEKLLNHKDVHARVFQALGNAYDYQGNESKAVETYKNGLKKFPGAGELYLELGNINLVKKDYNGALDYYEAGIQHDPKFPSNYYRAAKIFCNSDEEVWGMIYGEIFMNLERNSKRTEEISKLLFDTYKSEIKFTSDKEFGVSFSKGATINADDLKDPKKFKLPFGTGCYEMALSMAVAGEKGIDIHSLDRIRNRFLTQYFAGDYAAKYPNVLFDYQQEIKKAGHLEAYNHWLLMQGDTAGFDEWQKSNRAKADSFIAWFRTHPMQVSAAHRFYRAQY